MPAEPSLPPNEQAAATAEAKRMLRMLGDRFLTDHAHCARVASEARAIGEFAGDTELIALAEYELARCARQGGDLTRARQHFAEAARLCEALGDERQLAKSLHGMGTILSASGQLIEASTLFARARTMARKASDAVTLQRIANSQGIVHIRIGDYPAALADLEEALASLARDPDPALEASLLLNTGGVYQRMGDHERAMEYCKRSLALGRALADERHVASTLTFLGDTAIALERLGEGRAYLQEALAISERSGFPDIEVLSLRSLAELARIDAHPEEALTYLLRSLLILRDHPNPIAQQRTEQELGAVYLERGELALASRALQRAETLANEIASPQMQYEVTLLMGQLAEKKLDPHSASLHQARAEALREVLFNAESQRAMREHAMREAIGGGRSHEAEESPEQP